MKYNKKRQFSKLDQLLKSAATGNDSNNVIDKALATKSDRILKANIEFVRDATFQQSDNLQSYTHLKPSVDAELHAAQQLKQRGIVPRSRWCRVEPIPPAHFKCRKLFLGAK